MPAEYYAAIMPLIITAQNLLIKPYVKGLDINAMELLYLKVGEERIGFVCCWAGDPMLSSNLTGNLFRIAVV